MWPDAASQALASKLKRATLGSPGGMGSPAPESVAEVLVEALVYSAAKPKQPLQSCDGVAEPQKSFGAYLRPSVDGLSRESRRLGLPLLAQATSGSMTGPAQLNRMITGSEDLAPRPVMTCRPKPFPFGPEHQRIH
jgi:hypothetical protein